jgi:hypothetical protein
LQIGEFTVHFTHEFVKMQAGFALDGHCAVKAIHQKTFPPPNTTVHIYTTWNRGAIDQLLDGVRTLFTVLPPFTGTRLQNLHRSKLRWISAKATGSEFRLVYFSNRHKTLICYKNNNCYPLYDEG